MQDKTVLAGYVKRCAIFHATRVRSLTCCIKLVHGILASGLNDAAASDGIFAERSLALLRACVVSPDASLRRETNQFMLAIFARHPAAAANARARARPRTHTGAAEGGRTKHRSTARAELFLLALHAVLNDALDARCAAHSREEGAGLGAAPGSASFSTAFLVPHARCCDGARVTRTREYLPRAPGLLRAASQSGVPPYAAHGALGADARSVARVARPRDRLRRATAHGARRAKRRGGRG